jgi:SpoVK/Ycf46/Vps4 family AAA+-type ATPase
MADLDIPELNALLEEQLRVLGPDHPDTLMTRHVLARRIFHQGLSKEAYSLYHELVRDRIRVLGSDHPDTFSSRHNRALCRAYSGDAVGAISEFAELIPHMQEALGSDDLNVFHSRQQYALVMKLAGLTEEAISQWETLYQDLRKENSKNYRLLRETSRLIQNARESLGESEEDLLDDEVAVPPEDSVVLETPEDQVVPQSIEIRLGRAIANRAAEILGRETSQVAEALATDARAIAERINGGFEPKIAATLLSSLGVEPGQHTSGAPLQIVRDLAISSDPLAGRIGSQIAIAYVEVAFLAAGLDQKWDEHESETIDDLRRELRSILGSKIDTTSDATIEFERQFENIVGLEVVKEKLLGFVNLLVQNKRSAQRGGDAFSPRLHLALTGNPGTGKTTVARMYGELLGRLGFLESDRFTEVDKSGLVGEYQGKTENITSQVIQRANPGVLFVDEAYALSDSYPSGKGYGEMALEVIIKEMEDKRATLVVVLAGYTKEIDELMNVNPGLRSRLADVIEFPDYTTEELLEIARRVLAKRGRRMGEGVEDKMRHLFGEMRNRPNFGNARDVENMIAEVERNQNLRLAPLDDLATEDERKLLIVEDVPDVAPAPSERTIGFAGFL